MTGFIAAWSTESLKLRRSIVARLITPLLVVVVPLAAVGAVALARQPELPGAAATKFAPYAAGDLATAQLLVAGQILSVAVLIAGGFAAAWCYGREFAGGTAGALAGLSVSLRTIAVAKAALLAAWLSACAVAAVGVTVVLSVATGGRLAGGIWHQAGIAVAAGILAVALVLPFGWVATITRSQLGTIGVLIAVVAVTQIVVVLGAGSWLPYAVPSLLTGMGGAEVTSEIGPGSLLVTAVLAPIGLVAVAVQWRRLDDV